MYILTHPSIPETKVGPNEVHFQSLVRDNHLLWTWKFTVGFINSCEEVNSCLCFTHSRHVQK